MSGSIQCAGTVGYSAVSPVIVVFVSYHSHAWRDGSDGCYPESLVVVVESGHAHAWRVESGHAHAWRAGSDSYFFEIPVVVVGYGRARAVGNEGVVLDVSETRGWALIVPTTMG